MGKYLRYVIGIILIIESMVSLPSAIYAQQTKCNITGCIIDEHKMPVSYASVAIYSNNKPLAGTMTDDSGNFILKVAQSDGPYQVIVEFIGYTKASETIIPNKSQLNSNV